MHPTASPHHTASKPCHTLLTPAAVPAFVCTHSETHTHTRSDAPSYTLRWHYKFSVFIHRCTHDRTQLTIQSLFLAYMAHTWQPNQRGESAFSLSLCLYMSQRAKWDYCNPAWPQDRGNPNGVYFISSLHYFYPFSLFLLFGFSHFTPSFFHVPCPLYFALLPMLLPFYTFHIFIYKHTLKKKKKFSCWLYWQKSWQWILVWRLCFLTYCFLFLCLDDIVQKDDTPMYAAQIGSELQKQFAILPGWFDIIHMHKVAVNYFKTYITFSSFWYVKNMRVNPALWISLSMSVT